MREREVRFCNLWPVRAVRVFFFFWQYVTTLELATYGTCRLFLRCFAYRRNQGGAALPSEEFRFAFSEKHRARCSNCVVTVSEGKEVDLKMFIKGVY